MKFGIILGILLIFLAGCGKNEEIELETREFEREILRYAVEVADSGEEQLALQGELARWYNYGLNHGAGEGYTGILYYTDGILATLEIPSLGIHAPIYHGTASLGFGHDPSTPFPTGEQGEHTVLLAGAELELEPGEEFIIHILGKSLSYRVTALRQEPDTGTVAELAYCSILTPEGNQILAIREGEPVLECIP